MVVIEIKSGYNNGYVYHQLVLFFEPYSEDDIDEIVSEWCNNDPTGSTYGWSSSWEYITDTEKFNKAINDELTDIIKSIEMLEYKRNEIIKKL
jgi:hypothetical protein